MVSIEYSQVVGVQGYVGGKMCEAPVTAIGQIHGPVSHTRVTTRARCRTQAPLPVIHTDTGIKDSDNVTVAGSRPHG